MNTPEISFMQSTSVSSTTTERLFIGFSGHMISPLVRRLSLKIVTVMRTYCLNMVRTDGRTSDKQVGVGGERRYGCSH